MAVQGKIILIIETDFDDAHRKTQTRMPAIQLITGGCAAKTYLA